MKKYKFILGLWNRNRWLFWYCVNMEWWNPWGHFKTIRFCYWLFRAEKNPVFKSLIKGILIKYGARIPLTPKYWFKIPRHLPYPSN